MVCLRVVVLCVSSNFCRSHRLSPPSQLLRTCARWHSIRVVSKNKRFSLPACGARVKNNQPNHVRQPNSTATPRRDHHDHHHNRHRGRSMHRVQVGGDGAGGWVGGDGCWCRGVGDKILLAAFRYPTLLCLFCHGWD